MLDSNLPVTWNKQAICLVHPLERVEKWAASPCTGWLAGAVPEEYAAFGMQDRSQDLMSCSHQRATQHPFETGLISAAASEGHALTAHHLKLLWCTHDTFCAWEVLC